ncbi:MAG: hypothetical protein ACRC4N_02530 [Gammaproteobacteria bacterium]
MATQKKDGTAKKLCLTCKRARADRFFFKVDNATLFPDGRMNTCSDCVKESVDINDVDSVISFLRQIDKPYVATYWDEALESEKSPLGEYIRKINSLGQMKGKSFKDSDGFEGNGNVDTITPDLETIEITNIKGEKIEFSDSYFSKWGTKFKQHEYLKLEKFYQNMTLTHDIHSEIHKDLLVQLAKLSLVRDKFLDAEEMADYDKANKAYESIMKSAGFRPIDRQGVDDATGIRSFSQIWEEVEKKGYREPPVAVFERDVVDRMILSLENYYNRLVGKQLLASLPEETIQEMDAFYEVDTAPDEIDGEEDYENIDFSSVTDEEEIINIEILDTIEDVVVETPSVPDSNEPDSEVKQDG